MNGRMAEKIRKEIKKQYWKNFSRKPWGVPWFMWEKFMRRAFWLRIPVIANSDSE